MVFRVKPLFRELCKHFIQLEDSSVQLATFANASEILKTNWKELSACMWQKEIEHLIYRFPNINRHAFPDVVLAEADSNDDGCLDAKNNCFDM